MVELEQLVTEMRNLKSRDLDQMSALEIATLLNSEDSYVLSAVNDVLPQIATAIEWCSQALFKGARMIYIGAGTSGRLGLLDAVECPPTFGVSSETVIGIIAGGENAFVKAIEGAEDNEQFAIDDLKKINLKQEDVVIGIAASGRTPYCISGLNYAKSKGCKTISITNNPTSVMSSVADLAIELVTGPEVLTGSTRLKAGTAQKMALNMISTGSMILNGKVYQNLMVDVMQTNQKLVARAQKIVMEATGCFKEEAVEYLTQSEGNVKVAIVMILTGFSYEEAKNRLEVSNGFVGRAIK